MTFAHGCYSISFICRGVHLFLDAECVSVSDHFPLINTVLHLFLDARCVADRFNHCMGFPALRLTLLMRGVAAISQCLPLRTPCYDQCPACRSLVGSISGGMGRCRLLKWSNVSTSSCLL